MLILSRKIDEKIKIGDNITITLIDVHGDQVKIGVEAPKNVRILRKELLEEVKKQNKESSSSHDCREYILKEIKNLIK